MKNKTKGGTFGARTITMERVGNKLVVTSDGGPRVDYPLQKLLDMGVPRSRAGLPPPRKR